MNTKHTPAPWHTCEHSWSDTSIFSEGCKKLIAKLSIYNYATEENQQELESEMDANARLIAAAPDLLKLVQAFKIAATFEGLKSNPAWNDMLKEAEELINKIEQ